MKVYIYPLPWKLTFYGSGCPVLPSMGAVKRTEEFTYKNRHLSSILSGKWFWFLLLFSFSAMTLICILQMNSSTGTRGVLMLLEKQVTRKNICSVISKHIYQTLPWHHPIPRNLIWLHAENRIVLQQGKVYPRKIAVILGFVHSIYTNMERKQDCSFIYTAFLKK